MTASGTCGYGPEFGELVDIRSLGAFVTKAISPEARKGNAPERIVETTGGMLNAIGLANIGLDRFVAADSGVSDGGIPDSVLEDACEAVIGAVYLDGGLAPASELIGRLWEPLMTDRPLIAAGCGTPISCSTVGAIAERSPSGSSDCTSLSITRQGTG